MEAFRAASLFQPTNLNGAIGAEACDGPTERPSHLFGAVLGIPHVQMARLVAVLGFDYIFVDTLHAATNPETLVSLIQTINFASEGKTCALVRVPSHDSDLLPYALDAGAAGIIFPQVDTPEQAAAVVSKVRYAYGGGTRSVSPFSLLDGITNVAPKGWTSETIADRNVAVICQIESTLGVDNIDAIATTPGVNVLMLGISDLKATLGLPVRNPGGLVDESRYHEAVAKMIRTSKEHGIQLMMPAFRANPDDMETLRNFKMLLTSVDIFSVMNHHRTELVNMKKALGFSEMALNGKSTNGKSTNGKLTNGKLTNGKSTNGGLTNGKMHGHNGGFHNKV